MGEKEQKANARVKLASPSSVLGHWAYAFRGSSSTRLHARLQGRRVLGKVADDITAPLNIALTVETGGAILSALHELEKASVASSPRSRWTFAEPSNDRQCGESDAAALSL